MNSLITTAVDFDAPGEQFGRLAVPRSWLAEDQRVSLVLDASYEETCRALRLL